MEQHPFEKQPPTSEEEAAVMGMVLARQDGSEGPKRRRRLANFKMPSRATPQGRKARARLARQHLAKRKKRT